MLKINIFIYISLCCFIHHSNSCHLRLLIYVKVKLCISRSSFVCQGQAMYVRVTSMGRVSKAGRVCLRHTNLNSMLSRNFRVSAKSSQCLEQLVTCVVQILLWNPKTDIIIPFIQILTESIFIYSLFLQSIILFVEISFEKKNVYHLQLIYGIKYEIKRSRLFFWKFLMI